ncbi:acyl-CoA thioesterase [Salipiger abyssi]|uniref:acyl-CoA thioesterase n=1 Tax=Salipiger abyssi TaxID=1250539 RepID=UPI001A8EF3D7|nr:acyl-CoA thioesterase [Salipiger abyssi]MBN9888716.1 acyl-CoA thioesterase [Salipiger abyssi]
MFPFIRMAKEIWLTRKQPPLAHDGVHVSHHMCWPWDLDMWNELNNGRTLTLLDLGRFPLAMRTGLIGALRRERWRLTMAGVVVRYRRRIQTFERVEMHSRLIGWDRRFLYIEQSLWKADGDCATHAVYRAAVTDRNGIVGTDRVTVAMGIDAAAPELPVWVQHWLRAEDERPWPPERG